MDDLSDRVSCIAILSQDRATPKRGGEIMLPAGKQGLWRKQQKSRAARLEKQLRAKWALEELIEDQMNRFNAQYNQAKQGATLLKDVSQILVPEGGSPLEMASLGWMGDWRPTSILELLKSPSFSPSMDQVEMDRTLSQLIRDIRIEETILDEEMGEIQATCILHLPFGNCTASGQALEKVRSEFKKIDRVISKAQQLRFKALESIVKKVLNQTDAAEFLVMFAAIQDSIHQFCGRQKLKKVPVSVPAKSSEMDAVWEPSTLRRLDDEKMHQHDASRHGDKSSNKVQICQG